MHHDTQSSKLSAPASDRLTAYSWAVHSQTQHCCFEESYRWGGEFPIFKCVSIAQCQRFTITSQLTEFQRELISGGASGFVFEDQPPDAFEFQFGKTEKKIKLYILLDCILHFFPLLTILHVTFHLSTPWIDVKALTLLVAKAELGCPNPILTLSIHLWYFHHSFLFFVLLPEGFSSYKSSIGQNHHIARKTEEFYFIWGQTVNVSAIPLIFLSSRGYYSLSEPLEARERLRKVKEMLASPNFILTLGALSTSCKKVPGSSSLQTKAAVL